MVSAGKVGEVCLLARSVCWVGMSVGRVLNKCIWLCPMGY
jgi:hypothetical protein